VRTFRKRRAGLSATAGLSCSNCHREDVDLKRSWMLPVFRDHIQDTQIAFFAEYFLPLASRLKVKCKIFVIIYIPAIYIIINT